MRLSFIIPVINESAALGILLPKLRTYRDHGHEIILVDGGSTGNTVNIAVLKVDHLLSCEPGRAKQMNIGANAAPGDWLIFLHADTQLPQNIDKIIEHATASENINIENVWGRFDLSLSGEHWLFRIIEKMINWRSKLTGIATGDQVIFVKREVFFDVDGYPEIVLMEDIALSKKLKTLSRPICISNRVITSSRRWEKNGVLKTIILMWWLRLLYFIGVEPEKLVDRYYQKTSNQKPIGRQHL